MTRTRVFVGATLVGVAVLTIALFITTLGQGGTAQIVGYQHTGDPRRIVVVVALGQLDDIAERQVSEDDRSVRVTVRKRTTPGTAPDVLLYFPVTVALERALGDRAVLDQKGAPVTDLGTYQAPLPSPRP